MKQLHFIEYKHLENREYDEAFQLNLRNALVQNISLHQ